jgi:hypothetical protein
MPHYFAFPGLAAAAAAAAGSSVLNFELELPGLPGYLRPAGRQMADCGFGGFGVFWAAAWFPQCKVHSERTAGDWAAFLVHCAKHGDALAEEGGGEGEGLREGRRNRREGRGDGGGEKGEERAARQR